jgi:hypothetical protein
VRIFVSARTNKRHHHHQRLRGLHFRNVPVRPADLGPSSSYFPSPLACLLQGFGANACARCLVRSAGFLGRRSAPAACSWQVPLLAESLGRSVWFLGWLSAPVACCWGIPPLTVPRAAVDPPQCALAAANNALISLSVVCGLVIFPRWCCL